MQVKVVEIIRILFFLALGGILMFLVQPQLYQNQVWFFFIGDQPVDIWMNNEYYSGATLVFSIATFATLFWYFWSARAKISRGEQAQGWKLAWAVIGVFPVLGIGAAIKFFNTSPDGLATLTFLYVIDVLILYWLSTATSSPAPVRYVPPLSEFLRPLFGSDN